MAIEIVNYKQKVIHTLPPNVRTLKGADFRGGLDLRGAELSAMDLSGANFQGADLRDAVFSGSQLRNADFRGADLRGALFDEARLDLTDFRGADCSGGSFVDAKMHRADLSNGFFMKTDFVIADC